MKRIQRPLTLLLLGSFPLLLSAPVLFQEYFYLHPPYASDDSRSLRNIVYARYGAPEGVMRGLEAENSAFQGYLIPRIKSLILRARLEGRKAKFLIIGIGGGRIIDDMRRRFPGLELVFINKEPIHEVITPEEYFDYIHQKQIAPDRRKEEVEDFFEFLTSPAHLIIHDVEGGLPHFTDGELEGVLVASVVLKYISYQGRQKLYSEIQRVVRIGGEVFLNGFVDCGRTEPGDENDYFLTLDETYQLTLRHVRLLYDAANDGVLEYDHATLTWINKGPEEPFPASQFHGIGFEKIRNGRWRQGGLPLPKLEGIFEERSL
ncbi:MAG: hypothetical protein HYS56_00895 [Candidatus Omnitrophica bacterium]|nr:hypothetical protein [Candidatus Omnitrophota bacterium]